MYRGEPLKFGTVIFQNTAGGQPASGIIQPDGAFTLSTPKMGEGARPGQYMVAVYCYDSQDPSRQATANSPDQSLGKFLIPRKYMMPSTSGLNADVKLDSNEPIVLELSDK